ncbi:MAG: HD domain-containing protein [Candidatus Omnitrophica bacterium]|nr:HD domain-containing protein [Candidatus Omnitrophota bacterium]MDD5352250.1 HD domain-containing protein [Candidatus Omnitrophota bacterium]MDD5549848.1 HD domain-containing protein [Candidatus Omnitrophota bacterium]
MKINYKKELEDAARKMILVHRPKTLIQLIVRMIVHKVKVRHAGILLFNQKLNSYILTVSRGRMGLKIPSGFIRIDPDNAMIRFFTNKHNYQYIDGGALVYSKIGKILKNRRSLSKHKDLKETLVALRNQMNLFEAVVCIPSYFQDKLLGILFLGKKISGRHFHRDELDFFIALAHDVAMAIRNAQLFEELQEQIERNKRMFLETTKALASTIDAKDHYTHGHTERVTQVSLAITKKLIITNRIDVDSAFLDDLNIAALLHDIGKIGVPENILNKKGELNDEERRKINEHPLIGAGIIEPIEDLKRAIDGVKYHHEHFDGTGYPEGLKGNRIPLIAAIIAVTDSYDAMTTNRPYRPALNKKEAVEEIRKFSGVQFHPLVVKALVELYEEGGL